MAQEQKNSFKEITKCLNQPVNSLKNSSTGVLSSLQIVEKIYNLQDMISDQLHALRSLHISVAKLKDINTRTQCEQIIKKHEKELAIQAKKLYYFEQKMTVDHDSEFNAQEVVLWVEKCFQQNEKEFISDMKTTFNESSYPKIKGLSESLVSIKKSHTVEGLKEAIQEFCKLESHTDHKKIRGFFEKLLGKTNKESETLSVDEAQKYLKESLKESGI